MSRDTSFRAYKQIKEEGLLGRLRWAVYDCLYKNGPLTQRKTWELITHNGSANGGITTRFSELERAGVIKTIGKTNCESTGRLVYLWDVTSAIPVAVPKPETNQQKVKRLEAELKALRESLCKRCQNLELW